MVERTVLQSRSTATETGSRGEGFGRRDATGLLVRRRDRPAVKLLKSSKVSVFFTRIVILFMLPAALMAIPIRDGASASDPIPGTEPGGAPGLPSLQAPENAPPVSRWVDPLNRPPVRHSVSKATGPLDLRAVPPAFPKGTARGDEPGPSAGRICIVVHEEVYDLIFDGLGQYEADLAAMGYGVVTLVYASGSPEGLRAYLAQMHREPGSLVGAVFVGEIPYVLFEMYESFGDNDPTFTDFPTDVFFMDLNGTWADQLNDGEVKPQNGKYDTWSGHRELEIWVCRLKPSSMTAFNSADLPSAELQSSLLNAYFERNHRYRVGGAFLSHEGLVYNDDIWEGFGPDDARALGHVFGDSHVVSECRPEVTTREDYLKSRLPAAPQLVLLRAHGFVGGHVFDPDVDYVLSEDYRDVDPRTPFFSLYVCSGSDYTADDSLAGTLVFNPEATGLLTWGTTKTGGMWNDEPYYQLLGQGRVFGEAFRLWFNEMLYFYGAVPGFVLKWWGGMVLTGDAALKPLTASSPQGSLTVTLSPPEAVAAGARWKVDGGDWQGSGATVEGLCVLGEHIIQFEEIPGWVTPPKRGVGFAGGLARTVSSVYSSESGTVRVTLEPPLAVSAGARWRLDGGTWLRSGSSLAGVSSGSHTLEFKDVPGWTRPSDQTVGIETGSTLGVSGAYLQQSGSLTVTLGPEELSDARWRLTGGTWQTSGTTVAGLSVGPHTIEFVEVPGWTRPPTRVVIVDNEQTTHVVETYLQQTGSVVVRIHPSDAVSAGARWSLDGGMMWHPSDAPLPVPPGTYTATFRAISGWTAPGSRTFTVEAGEATVLEDTYTPLLSADFAAAPTIGIAPLRVTFIDRSTGSLAPPKKWLWEFGDGYRSTRQNPVYTYRKPGSYTVTLTVTTADGRTSTRTYQDLISVHTLPKAAFTATPVRGKVPLPVSFSDRSTGVIESWQWDFGDGTGSAEPSPVYTYEIPGRYTVRLTVRGPMGSSTIAKVITALK